MTGVRVDKKATVSSYTQTPLSTKAHGKTTRNMDLAVKNGQMEPLTKVSTPRVNRKAKAPSDGQMALSMWGRSPITNLTVLAPISGALDVSTLANGNAM